MDKSIIYLPKHLKNYVDRTASLIGCGSSAFVRGLIEQSYEKSSTNEIHFDNLYIELSYVDVSNKCVTFTIPKDLKEAIGTKIDTVKVKL